MVRFSQPYLHPGAQPVSGATVLLKNESLSFSLCYHVLRVWVFLNNHYEYKKLDADSHKQYEPHDRK